MAMILLTALFSLSMPGGLSMQGAPDPRITAVVPERLTAGPKAQMLTVSGENFRNDLTLSITTPGGAVRPVDAKAISQQQPKSFRVSLVLDEVGRYELVVANGDGRRSPPFELNVRAAAQQPWIERVEPEEVGRMQEAQSVTLAGRNFEAGLRMSISDPTGAVMQATTIDRVTPLMVVVRIAFETSGRYEIRVTNASGQSSNTVAITVRPPA